MATAAGATVHAGAASAHSESESALSSPSHTAAGVGSASSATSFAVAPDAERTIQKFKTLVSLDDLTPRGLTDGVRQCIETATQLSTLDLIERLMHGYKSNNMSAFGKRVLASVDAVPPDAPAPERPDLPRRLQRCLAVRRSQLSGKPPPERPKKRRRVAEVPLQAGPAGMLLPEVEQRPGQGQSVPSTSATEPRAVSPSTGTDDSVLLQQLAGTFGVEAATITGLRRQGELFSCIDVVIVVTKQTQSYAAQQLKRVREYYPEVMMHNFKFPGRGQRETPVADVLELTRMLVHLPKVDVGKCLQLAVFLGRSVGVSEEAIIEAARRHCPRRIQDREEIALLRLLKRHGYEYTAQVGIEGKRIDAVVELGRDARAVIEVDERQHKSYGMPNEVARMLAIKEWAEELGGVTWLVRFNPHGFRCGSRRVDVSWHSATQSLVNVLREAAAADDAGRGEQSAFCIVFLYYDCDVEGRPLIIDDPHIPTTLRDHLRHFDLGTQTMAARRG